MKKKLFKRITYTLGSFFFLLSGNCNVNAQKKQESVDRKTVLAKPPAVRFILQAGIRAGGADRSTAFMFRPSAGLLFNERLYAGIAADLVWNERFLKDASYQPLKNESAYWELNFTGLKLDYSFLPQKAINPGLGMFTGFGHAERNFTWNGLNKQSPEYALFDKRLCNRGYFYFAEPSLFLNFNLSNSFLLRTGMGYRAVAFRNTEPVPGMINRRFSKPIGGITIIYSARSHREK